jgi:hypothetical protein
LPFSQPLVLIVIDLFQGGDMRNALFGINIDIYHKCTLHKSMEKIFDQDILAAVTPHLKNIREKGL